MATSLIGGLIAHGVPARSLWVTDTDPHKVQHLSERYGVQSDDDNARAVGRCAVVVLAVKPQVMRPVIEGLAVAAARHDPLIVSIAAGVRVRDMLRWFGYGAAIVRCMPNTPALVGCGATALYAGERVSEGQRQQAESILQAVGICRWVEREAQLDAVTALSGSGPAYYFLLMEIMETVGVELGLDEQTARALTLQTALGAARMALESETTPGCLRERVTSPGGTTEGALDALRLGDAATLWRRALTAARDRSEALGDSLGAA